MHGFIFLLIVFNSLEVQYVKSNPSSYKWLHLQKRIISLCLASHDIKHIWLHKETYSYIYNTNLKYEWIFVKPHTRIATFRGLAYIKYILNWECSTNIPFSDSSALFNLKFVYLFFPHLLQLYMSPWFPFTYIHVREHTPHIRNYSAEFKLGILSSNMMMQFSLKYNLN